MMPPTEHNRGDGAAAAGASSSATLYRLENPDTVLGGAYYRLGSHDQGGRVAGDVLIIGAGFSKAISDEMFLLSELSAKVHEALGQAWWSPPLSRQRGFA